MDGNPQVEDGYTRIANELLEALAKAMAQGIITGRERAIIDWIIRYTYGFHQTNGHLRTSFIAKSLQMSSSEVSQILTMLYRKHIIIKNGFEIQLNKHYNEWEKILYYNNLEISKQNLEISKHLEISKQHLEISKQHLEISKHSQPTAQEENKSPKVPKENIYKEKYIKKDIRRSKINFNFELETFENIAEEKISKWQSKYPALNVKQELSMMEAWLAANPRKASAIKNFEQFIVNWLNRSTKEVLNHGRNSKYVAVHSHEEHEERDLDPGCW